MTKVRPATSEASPSDGRSRVWLLAGGLALVAAVLQLALLPGTGPLDAWWVVVLLAAGFLAAELALVHFHFGREALSFTLTEIPLVIGLALVSPITLVVGRLLGTGTVLALRRQPLVKRGFNLALAWLEPLVALTVWRAVADGAAMTTPRGWIAVISAVMAAHLLGSFSVTTAIRLSVGDRPGLMTMPVVNTLPSLANGSFGLLVVYLVGIDWRAIWMLGVVSVILYTGYRAHGSLRQRHNTLEAVARFTREVGRAVESRSVVHAAVTQLRVQLEAELAEIVMFDDQGRSGMRLTSRHDGEVEVVWGSPGFAGVLLHGGPPQPVLFRRGARTGVQRQLLEAAGVHDAILTPLERDDRVIGTIVVADRLGSADGFDIADLHALETLANHVSIAIDNGQLTDRLRQQVKENQHQAMHDTLTGLPNLSRFRQEAQELLSSGMPVAILLLDLDRFKEINDTLGHRVGDRLLAEVGVRLLATSPSGSSVARLGGDEFIVHVPCAQDEAERMATRFREALHRPFSLDGLTVVVDASIGIALSPDHGSEIDQLVQRADVAMYQAKASRTGIEVYEPRRDPYSPSRLALVAELRNAVTSGQLSLHYQPKAELEGAQVKGVEALVRWMHSERGFLLPDEFIPVAEHTGIVEGLTEFVLESALTQCREWEQRGLDLPVAVNLSPRALHDDRIVERIARTIEGAGIDAARLTLEITETTLITEPERTVAMLHELAELGVGLALDDVGTGYSSLSHLKRLPVDEVKIDRTFVQNLGADATDEAIVAAIIELGHRLGKTVVAEGVEDPVAWRRLRALKCDLAQGYFLCRPMEPRAFEKWLSDHISIANAHAIDVAAG